MRLRGVLALACVAILAGSACSKTLDMPDLEAQIKDGIEEQVDVSISAVDCPDEVEAETGATFECKAEVSDGSSATVEVTQTDDEGNVDWVITEADPAS